MLDAASDSETGRRRWDEAMRRPGELVAGLTISHEGGIGDEE